MTAIDVAIATQRVAADPDASTWLTANAGSGKTRVLTDRVARLLLQEVPPENILCLTFTKAAAGEMQNRLFGTLGSWSMADDSDLLEALAGIGEAGALDDAALRRARRLFAQAIDTPGGLKIQTIHAFAAALLRQFPLEAGVAPSFAELDDAAARALRRSVLDDMAADATSSVQIANLLVHLPSGQFERISSEITHAEPDFSRALSREEIYQWLDLDPELDSDLVQAGIFSQSNCRLISSLLPVIAAGSTNDLKLHAKLAQLNLKAPTGADWQALEGAFLTTKFERVKNPVTQATRQRLDSDAEALDDLIDEVLAARDTRLSLLAVQATLALHAFARGFLKRYARKKSALGVLDFDDLIRKSAALLNRSDTAEWVLYRLDGWIDHILVDEAQDTSPEQWQIIEALAREFTAGQGARPGNRRTLFVVGDPKQSIYAFQGADLEVFAKHRALFQSHFAAAELLFREQPLLHSFRSSPLILDLVDRVSTGARGLGRAEPHLPVREELPGRIEVLPRAEKADKGEKPKFGETDALVAAADPAVVLAEQLARRIKDMLGYEWITEKEEVAIRPLRPEDILVLLRKRSRFMAPFIAACKRHGVPVAGADRLQMKDEIAVKDVLALLSFLDLPEDDLSLACVLRSPLFGWTEQDLFMLAHHRDQGQTLWSALRDSTEFHPEDVARLSGLLSQIDLLRPYDLLETVLTAQGGRRQLVARLGPECNDPLDGLLDLALEYERFGPPSLTGFLAWLDGDETTIKRPTGQPQGLIRVMSVHGAKGLEAPVVILPDTGIYRDPNPPPLQVLAPGRVTLRANAENAAPAHLAAKEAARIADEDEDDRLLYVALTRAQSWLIVAAWNEVKDDDSSWYNRIHAAVSAMGATLADGTLAVSFGLWPAGEPLATKPATPIVPFDLSPPPKPERRQRFLSPSTLTGHGFAEGQTGDDARARGIFIHHLLEHLPEIDPSLWRQIAFELAEVEVGYDGKAAADEALRVLDHPLFGHKALTEASFAADLLPLGNQPIIGRIDRIVDLGDYLMIVDFKSDRVPAARPEDLNPAYRAQMAAYVLSLQQIVPNRQIKAAIMWTASAVLMELPNEIVMTARGTPPTS